MDMELADLQRVTTKRDNGLSEYINRLVMCKLAGRAERCHKGELSSINMITIYD